MEMMNKLDLLLVKPGGQKKIFGELNTSLSAIEPPLWAALIASIVREKGYSVKILDIEAENFSLDESVDRIIAYNPILVEIIVTGTNLSASTWNMPGAETLLTALKEKSPNIKTLLWGLHPSALPERTLKEENVDFVIQGEGFSTILQILKMLKSCKKIENNIIDGLYYKRNGRIIKGGYSQLVRNLDSLPRPSWDLLPMEKYRAHNWHCFNNLEHRNSYSTIYTSLGCPFDCKFCSVKALYGKIGIRYRDPIKVIEDIDYLINNYGIKNIKIIDECFVLNKKHVINICDLIIQRKYDLNIWCYSRIDTIDEEMLNKMKQAGFNWTCYGVESVSNKVLKEVNKLRYNKNKIKEIIDLTHNIGIYVQVNLMFGFFDDNIDTMQESFDFIKELQCEYVNFYVTMAYPGSQLYEDAVHNNIPLPKNWIGYSQYSEETFPLPTKYLSSSEVLNFRDKAFKDYYNNYEYQTMIKLKFGDKAVEHIQEMLKHKIIRKYA